jgi:hypothetical protein
MSSINTASNHQPVLVAVAQHGSLDDVVYFTVTADGKAAGAVAGAVGNGAGAGAGAGTGAGTGAANGIGATKGVGAVNTVGGATGAANGGFCGRRCRARKARAAAVSFNLNRFVKCVLRVRSFDLVTEGCCRCLRCYSPSTA